MWFGWVRGVWGAGGVTGVEVGVEREGVVGVALQGPDAVVMTGTEGVIDGVGEQRVRAYFDEGGVAGAAVAMAWLNRTGLRRLAAQWSASNNGALPVRSSVVLITGMAGSAVARSASAARSSGRIGSMIG